MKIVGGIILLLSLAGVLVGLFTALFRKGKRRRGLITFLVCLFAGLPLGGQISTLNSSKTVAGTKVKEIAATERTAQEVRVVEETPQPDTPVERVDPRLLEAASLRAFCSALDDNDALHQRADRKFGEEGTIEKLTWKREQEAALSASVSKTIGLPFEVWSSYAAKDGWSHRCDALAKGWLQVTLADIKAASEDDIERVNDAITLNFIQRLDRNEGGDYFDNDRYAVVRCSAKPVGDWKIIGCLMRGGLGNPNDYSDPVFYTTASLNGSLVIIPLDATAVALMQGNSLGDVENKPLSVGKYVGPYPMPDLDWPSVKRDFRE